MAGLFVIAPVAAVAADLEDYLEGAGSASFAGRQATWCSYRGQTEFKVVSVEHAGSVTMVENAGSSQVIGGGRNAVIDEATGIAISDWSQAELSSRYVTASVDAESRLGRDVVVVTVDEGNVVRAKIWFDDETGAPLGSEIYDGAGNLFRLSWMLDFDPYPRKIFSMMGDKSSTYDVVVPVDADDLPSVVAGYARVDSYAGPDESVHAFYTDGLFSFSVFRIEGQVESSPFAAAEEVTIAGASYRWLLTPSDLWINWNGDGLSFVLVGDLPPDHLEQVLAELPAPAAGNIFTRIWHGLFG
jgi:negative regulator of sigma E activity